MGGLKFKYKVRSSTSSREEGKRQKNLILGFDPFWKKGINLRNHLNQKLWCPVTRNERKAGQGSIQALWGTLLDDCALEKVLALWVGVTYSVRRGEGGRVWGCGPRVTLVVEDVGLKRGGQQKKGESRQI